MVAYIGDADKEAGKQWLFRVHDDHWCSVREIAPRDMTLVEKLNKAPA